ncbi:MAG: HD domain-containing protein [Candidatus Shikimatogenerans bostrichidophilus]|nr:MAG: HD domain-containing protein [Candidatus Shikimatogenerans bostrichidophilus]
MYIKNNNLKINKILKIISDLSNKLKYKTYLIGGFVRNLFLKRKSYDIDIVTTGNSIKLAKIFIKKIKTKKIFIFKRFKTVIVKYKKYSFEFVSTRKEYYNLYNNKPKIKLLNSIKEDQNRRDFTINSIAISLNKKDYGKIIDKFNGIKDIKKKYIKTPRNPDKTLYEDPLRMIRAIRFSSEFCFKIDKNLKKSIIKNRDRIRIISIERIIQEFNKILLSKKPSIGLKLMNKFGFLYIILPEFVDLKNQEEKNGFSYKNNFIHTLKVLDKISKYSNNLWLRWATLLHDIGKPISKHYTKKKGWCFYYHEIIGSNMVPKIFYRLKLPMKNNMKYVQKIIKYSNKPTILSQFNVKNKTILKFIYKIKIKYIKNLLLLSYCDITTKNKFLKKEKIKKINKLYKKIKYLIKKKIYIKKIPINGYDIMNYFKTNSSPKIGKIKKEILNKIKNNKVKNNYKDIFKLMIKIGKKYFKND